VLAINKIVRATPGGTIRNNPRPSETIDASAFDLAHTRPSLADRRAWPRARKNVNVPQCRLFHRFGEDSIDGRLCDDARATADQLDDTAFAVKNNEIAIPLDELSHHRRILESHSQ
jgi:hypothetical protein